MRNIFKDFFDVVKYKRQRNTAINRCETVEKKYLELLEMHIEQQNIIKSNVLGLNNKFKELNIRVSNLEEKKRK